MKTDESMGVLNSFTWTYVKYANMEGVHRDSHNYHKNAANLTIITELRI